MALILTKEIETPEGIVLKNAYVNIEQVYIHKPSRSIQLNALVYASESKRLENKKHIEVPNFGTIQGIIGDDVDLATTTMFSIGYLILKAHLKKLGIEFKDKI